MAKVVEDWQQQQARKFEEFAMALYNLSHLTQDSHHLGPAVQDDEALFLFALIRVMHLRRVLEIGGFKGYSARNFLAAVGQTGAVYTVDIKPVAPIAPNHIILQKDAGLVDAADIGGEPLDLVFFDCHVYEAQMAMFGRLRAAGMIAEGTVLALHDTNLFPRKVGPQAYQVDGGWVHETVERRMVNDLHGMGYDVFVLGTNATTNTAMRKGLTIARMFKPLLL
jgi:predicted O-methyltransferase YrrM